MNDSELVLLVIQCGGEVRMTVSPAKDKEDVYTFPSTEALKKFVKEMKNREWDGLTDDEIEDAWIEASDEYDETICINNLGRLLESKLKEKNT